MAEAKPPASHGEQKDTPRVRYLTLAYGGIACFVGAVLSWALALIMVGLAEIIAIGYYRWGLQQLEGRLEVQKETENGRERQQLASPAPKMPVNDKEVEHIWNFYIELGLIERHFNEIQSGYRRLASTWLLAAFAAIGFVLSTKLTLLIPPELVIAALGMAGSVGIYLIWVIDLLVNQRLLDATYSQSKDLETTHKWLPQVRNNMRVLLRGKGMSLILWFYIAGTEIMAFVGGVGLLLWLYTTPPAGNIDHLITIDYVLGMVLVLMFMRVKTSFTPHLEAQIKSSGGVVQEMGNIEG